jgi:AcrR family transcriptional regulator
LAERTTGAEEKRQLLLQAATRVFARKGFHASRVGDIAEEAGVAHGLLYHYFASKEEVLDAIFRDEWADLLDEIEQIESSDASAREQLRRVAGRILGQWERNPDIIRVIERELARSPEVQKRIGELVKPIEAIQRIIGRGRASGEFREDLDPLLAGIFYYGGIDELLSGWVLGQLRSNKKLIAAAERQLDAIVAGAFLAVVEASSAAADELGEARDADVPA